jgi:hypothetical protein
MHGERTGNSGADWTHRSLFHIATGLSNYIADIKANPSSRAIDFAAQYRFGTNVHDTCPMIGLSVRLRIYHDKGAQC